MNANLKSEKQERRAWRWAIAGFVVAECFAILAAVASAKNGWGPTPFPPMAFILPLLAAVPWIMGRRLAKQLGLVGDSAGLESLQTNLSSQIASLVGFAYVLFIIGVATVK